MCSVGYGLSFGSIFSVEILITFEVIVKPVLKKKMRKTGYRLKFTFTHVHQVLDALTTFTLVLIKLGRVAEIAIFFVEIGGQISCL